MFCLAKWIHRRHVPCCSESIALERTHALARTHTHTHTCILTDSQQCLQTLTLGMCLCCLRVDMGLIWNSVNAVRFCLLIKSGRLSAHGKMIIPQGNTGTQAQAELITEQDTHLSCGFSKQNCDPDGSAWKFFWHRARFVSSFAVVVFVISTKKKDKNQNLYFWQKASRVKWQRRATVEMERLARLLPANG